MEDWQIVLIIAVVAVALWGYLELCDRVRA
jgi:hypothetical protein